MKHLNEAQMLSPIQYLLECPRSHLPLKKMALLFLSFFSQQTVKLNQSIYLGLL